MIRKVGRMTLAAALIAAGVVVLIDNVLGTEVSWYVARLWPGLIILLGLEWLAASARAQRDGVHPTADAGAIVLLIVVALVAASSSNWSRAPWNHRSVTINPNFHVDVRVPEVNIPAIPPLSFGNAAADATQTAPLNLDQIRELVVNNPSGAITVQDGPEAKVELRVHAYGRDVSDAEMIAREFRLQIENGSRTTIKIQRPNVTRFDTSLVITLPRDANVALNVETASGAISVVDRGGDVILATASGSIRAERIGGNADLRTSSGSITVTDVSGNLAANSSSGSINATAIRGAAKVGSTSGSVTLNDVGGKVSAQASSGMVNVITGTVGGDYDLSAVSGGVRLLIPGSANVTLTARASSGQVSGPSWLSIGEGRNSGSGRLGDGTYKVNLRTTSGDVRIDAR